MLADEVEHLLGTPRCAEGMQHDLRDPNVISNPRGRLEDQVALLPSPRATDGTKGGPNQRGSSGDLMLPSAVQLLGTPRASEWKGTGPVGSKSHTHRLERDYLDAQVVQLAETQRLLPTPMVGSTSPAAHGQISGQWRDQMTDALAQWGDYAAAITRWETVLGRPAPAATMTSAKGNPQLSPRFVEFLMGLPVGWVTDVPDITRNEALRALGNGVVPQQCAAALRLMLRSVVEV